MHARVAAAAFRGGPVDEIPMSHEDADRLGIHDGEAIRLTSPAGSYTVRAKIDQIKARNLEVHWPEGNCLLSREEIDVASREPDDNAIARVEKVGEP